MSLPQATQQKLNKDSRAKDQFSIRKVHNKLDMDRGIMRPMSPYQIKLGGDRNNRERMQLSCKPNHKLGESNPHQAIMSSNVYKQLNRKFVLLKKEQAEQRQKLLNSIKEKSSKVQKAKQERERLEKQKERLNQMAQQLSQRLQLLRQRNMAIRQNVEQYQSMVNAEYLRNLILSVRFQHELMHQDINPDNMTYEQLLQLEEKIGNVSKGLTEQQLNKLIKFQYSEKSEAQTCTICYYEAKVGETVMRFPCKHLFHAECIQEWLSKEKVCPMCKQQIVENTPSPP